MNAKRLAAAALVLISMGLIPLGLAAGDEKDAPESRPAAKSADSSRASFGHERDRARENAGEPRAQGERPRGNNREEMSAQGPGEGQGRGEGREGRRGQFANAFAGPFAEAGRRVMQIRMEEERLRVDEERMAEEGDRIPPERRALLERRNELRRELLQLDKEDFVLDARARIPHALERLDDFEEKLGDFEGPRATRAREKIAGLRESLVGLDRDDVTFDDFESSLRLAIQGPRGEGPDAAGGPPHRQAERLRDEMEFLRRRLSEVERESKILEQGGDPQANMPDLFFGGDPQMRYGDAAPMSLLGPPPGGPMGNDPMAEDEPSSRGQEPTGGTRPRR